MHVPGLSHKCCAVVTGVMGCSASRSCNCGSTYLKLCTLSTVRGRKPPFSSLHVAFLSYSFHYQGLGKETKSTSLRNVYHDVDRHTHVQAANTSYLASTPPQPNFPPAGLKEPAGLQFTFFIRKGVLAVSIRRSASIHIP